MYLTCVITIVSMPYLRGPLPGVRDLGVFVWLATAIPMIWLAARRRKNWARWILLGIFVVGTLNVIARAFLGPISPAVAGWRLMMAAMEGGAYVFAFTGGSVAWFAAKDKPDVTVF